MRMLDCVRGQTLTVDFRSKTYHAHLTVPVLEDVTLDVEQLDPIQQFWRRRWLKDIRPSAHTLSSAIGAPTR